MKRRKTDSEEPPGKKPKASERNLNEQQRPKGKRPPNNKGHTHNNMDVALKETSYFERDGMRYVRPYHYTFVVNAKRRWVGRTLLDVLELEYQANRRDYYEQAIANGRITVQGQRVSADLVLTDNDWIEHTTHRHEPPVLATPIKAVLETDDLFVFDKPPSIPVHPCGRFRHNSVLFITAATGFPPLHSVHRLDRLTSGCLLMAKSKEAAKTYGVQIMNRTAKKTYLARVFGEFPTGTIEVDQPILNVEPSRGVNIVDAAGKEAQTKFERLSYNGHTSVVYCWPLTGRTHQIRVHLKHLGFPIANDPLYRREMFDVPGAAEAAASAPSASAATTTAASVPAATIIIDAAAPAPDAVAAASRTACGAAPVATGAAAAGQQLGSEGCGGEPGTRAAAAVAAGAAAAGGVVADDGAVVQRVPDAVAVAEGGARLVCSSSGGGGGGGGDGGACDAGGATLPNGRDGAGRGDVGDDGGAGSDATAGATVDGVGGGASGAGCGTAATDGATDTPSARVDFDPLCAECRGAVYADPAAHALSLWLHALSYEDEAGAWRFAVPPPAWADDGFECVAELERLRAHAAAYGGEEGEE